MRLQRKRRNESMPHCERMSRRVKGFFKVQSKTSGFGQKEASELGNSLISLVVAMGLFGLLIVGLSRLMVGGQQANKSVDIRQKLESTREMVRTRMSCKKTLGITASTSLPLACSSSARSLLTVDGKILGEGSGWSIKGQCEGNELIISAKMPSLKDPFSRRKMEDLPSNRSGKTVAQDLFGGTSDFCREFYQAPIAAGCSGTYNRLSGNYQGLPLCCRVESSPYSRNTAVAKCAANEWILSGWGSCEISPEWYANKAFLHVSNIDPVNNSWLADCYDTAATALNDDHPAQATAICCPTFY